MKNRLIKAALGLVLAIAMTFVPIMNSYAVTAPSDIEPASVAAEEEADNASEVTAETVDAQADVSEEAVEEEPAVEEAVKEEPTAEEAVEEEPASEEAKSADDKQSLEEKGRQSPQMISSHWKKKIRRQQRQILRMLQLKRLRKKKPIKKAYFLMMEKATGSLCPTDLKLRSRRVLPYQ